MSGKIASHVTDEACAELSAEVFSIPLDDGQYLLYAPLRRSAFIGNHRTVNWIADLKDGRIQPTNNGEDADLVAFLRQLEIVDAGDESSPVTRHAGSPKPTIVTLFMTTGCNLRCSYCYASAGDTAHRSMSLETACRGIQFVASNAAESPSRYFEVAYHGGGEPTSNWAVMVDSFGFAQERAQKLALTFRAATATNGVLRDDQIDWIISHLDGGASVSFDGHPDMHDKNRVTLTGAPSSQRVIHTMNRFDEVGYGYGVRVTVTRDLIPMLAESVEYICSNFSPQRIQVEPAYQLGRWEQAPSAETEDFIAAFREAQRCAGRYGQEIHFSAARVESLTNHFCGVTQDSFALTPDGNVSACYEVFAEDNPLGDVFFYGRPDQDSSGFVFNLPVLDNLRRQSVDHHDYCQGCFAKWHCAGDCYHKSLATNGRGEFQGTDRCHITRELTKDQLMTRIVESGGLFWHEPLPEDWMPDSTVGETSDSTVSGRTLE